MGGEIQSRKIHNQLCPETQRRPVPCEGEASNWTLDWDLKVLPPSYRGPYTSQWLLCDHYSHHPRSVCCPSGAHSCLTLCDPVTAALQESLYFTISRSLLKLVFTELVMTSNHLVLLTLWGSTNTQFLSFSQKTQIGVVGRVQPYGEQPARSPEGQTPLPGCLQGSSASRLLPSKRKCPRRAFQASCAGPQGYGPASLH